MAWSGRRIGVAVAAGLALLGCGPPPEPSPPTETVFLGDFDHDGRIDGAAASSSAGNSRDASRTLLVLCNCDDDDRDGRVDHLDARINGEDDANDLVQLLLTQPSRMPRWGLSLTLSSDPGRPRSEGGPAFRVFLGERAVLGPERGTRYFLARGERRRLGREGLQLSVEARAFTAAARLALREHHGARPAVLDAVDLRSTPLLVAPPGPVVECVAVCRNERNGLASRFHDAVREHCLACGIPADRIDSVPVGDSGHGGDWWLQDEVQWGYVRAPWQSHPMPVALHLPRTGALRAWAKGLLAPDQGYIRPVPLPRRWQETTYLCYGGNLDAMPAVPGHPLGRVCAGLRPGGRPLHPSARWRLDALGAFLATRLGQPLVSVCTSWLRVGHLDDVIAFLPSPSDGQRPVLLVASPGDGIRLLNDMAEEVVADPFARHYRHLVGAGAGEVYLWRDVLASPLAEGRAADLRAYNEALHETIFGPGPRAGGLVGEMLDGIGGDEARVHVVPVPAFFHPAPHARGVGARPLVPNAVNLAAIGRHLLVPEPHLPSFRAETERMLEGYDLRWIETFRYLHAKGGGVHCAVNVRYAPPREGRWWAVDEGP